MEEKHHIQHPCYIVSYQTREMLGIFKDMLMIDNVPGQLVLPQDYFFYNGCTTSGLCKCITKGFFDTPLALSHHYLLNEITIPLEMLGALVKHTITCNMQQLDYHKT